MSVAIAVPSASAAATRLHDRLVLAARALRTAEHELSVLLAEMAASRLFLELGFSTLCGYAETVLDLSVRKVRALLQLGRSLPDLPSLQAAFRAGTLGWTKARELLRVVTPSTDAAWTARALVSTSRDLEGQIDQARVGEPPPEAEVQAREPARKRWTFVLESPDADLLRTVLQVLRAQAGDPDLSDSVLLGEMARRILYDVEEEAPTGERHLTVLQTCPDCGHSQGQDTEVDDAIGAAARCDSQVVDLRPGPKRGHLTRKIPPARRRAVLARDGQRCAIPGCRCRLWLDLHHLDAYAGGGDHSEGNLVVLCSVHHRLLHEGRLGLWREGNALVVARAGSVTHVGCEGSRASPSCGPI